MYRAGVVGLGNLGRPIARRLMGLGPVAVNSRTRRRDLETAGAVWFDSLPALARGCPVVILSLPDYESVQNVVLGERGLLAEEPDGLLIVNISTISPFDSVRLASSSARLGARWIDAPVAGTVAAAESGSLLCMLGGDSQDILECEDLIAAFASQRVIVGDVGQASAMKLIVNLVLAATIQAVGEGIAYGERNGLDAEKVVEVLSMSPSSSRALERKGEQMVHGDFRPRATLRILHKDLVALNKSAAQIGGQLVAGGCLERFMVSAIEMGLGDLDFAVVVEASREAFRLSTDMD